MLIINIHFHSFVYYVALVGSQSHEALHHVRLSVRPSAGPVPSISSNREKP